MVAAPPVPAKSLLLARDDVDVRRVPDLDAGRLVELTAAGPGRIGGHGSALAVQRPLASVAVVARDLDGSVEAAQSDGAPRVEGARALDEQFVPYLDRITRVLGYGDGRLAAHALTEATSPFWRPIKYSLFPPLGLATLAGYLDEEFQSKGAKLAGGRDEVFASADIIIQVRALGANPQAIQETAKFIFEQRGECASKKLELDELTLSRLPASARTMSA